MWVIRAQAQDRSDCRTTIPKLTCSYRAEYRKSILVTSVDKTLTIVNYETGEVSPTLSQAARLYGYGDMAQLTWHRSRIYSNRIKAPSCALPSTRPRGGIS